MGSARLGMIAIAALMLPGGMINAGEILKSTSAAPSAWVAYATKVRLKIEAAFGGNDEVALRFHSDLERLYSLSEITNSDPLQNTEINVWMTTDGHVERVNLAHLPDAGTNQDLRELLSRISIEAPPKGMMQPIRLRLRLAAAQAPNTP